MMTDRASRHHPPSKPIAGSPDGDATLVDVLAHRAERTPDRVIYEFIDAELEVLESLTFGELSRRAREIGAVLQSRGHGGQTAMLVFPPGLAFIEAFFGCLAAGVIAVPVSPPDSVRLRRSLPRLRRIADDAKASVVLTAGPLGEGLKQAWGGDSGFADLEWWDTEGIRHSDVDEWPAIRPRGDDLAFLQYTSGSTAQPRGVQVSHGNLMANEGFIAEACGLSEADRGVSWLPMYHDMGLIGSVLQPLYSGFPVQFLSPITFLKRPLSWLAAISDVEATISPAPNFAFAYCTRRVKDDDVYMLDLSSWRVALNGAEPVSAEVMHRFCDKFKAADFHPRAFTPCYGLAEATLLVAGAKSADPLPKIICVSRAALQAGRLEIRDAPSSDKTRELVASGRTSAADVVRIVDPNSGKEKADGEIGEIWVSGPSVAMGYWRNPQETETVFGAALGGFGDRRFLRTGDLGAFVDGALVVTGRCKDLIIIRGKNHYPQDLELSAEYAHPTVVSGAVAAFGVEREGAEALVMVAEVSTRQLDQSVLRGVAESIREAVTHDHDLSVQTVVLVARRSLPKTSSGKLRRSACKTRFLNDELACLYLSSLDTTGGDNRNGGRTTSGEVPMPSNAEIRTWLFEQLAKHLGMAPREIDPKQSFDALGLDSHTAVELVDAAESWLGREVDPAMFYKYPTIELLLRHLYSGSSQD